MHSHVSLFHMISFIYSVMMLYPPKNSKDATALSWHKIGNHVLIKSNSHETSNIRDKRTDLMQRWKLKFSPSLCIQAEGNTYFLLLAKITAPVEFCIVPGFLLTCIFLSLWLGGLQGQWPFLSLCWSSLLIHSTALLPVCDCWTWQISSLVLENYTPRSRAIAQSISALVQSQRLHVTLQPPWVSEVGEM